MKQNILSIILSFVIFIQTFFSSGGVFSANAQELENLTDSEIIESTNIDLSLEDVALEDLTQPETEEVEESQIHTKEVEVKAKTMYSATSSAIIVNTYDALKTAIESLIPGQSAEYKINDRFTATSVITIPQNTTVILSVDSSLTDTNIIARSQNFYDSIIEVSEGATLYLRCTISGEKDTEGGYYITDDQNGGYYGQALITNYGITILDNSLSKLTNNYNPEIEKSHHGGGIYNLGTLKMFNGYISNNHCSKTGGGGIFNEGILELTGGFIESNESYSTKGYHKGYGGGIYSIKSFDLPTGVIIRNNTANDGGGVCLYTDWDATDEDIVNVTLDGAEILNNSAYDGGGIYIYQSNLIVKSGKISGNNAGNMNGKSSYGDGGAIFLEGRSENRGVLTILGGEISNNTVISSYGARGGAIYTHYGIINMKGGLITNNSCDGGYSYGGAITLEENGTLNFIGGTISKNIAQYGGAIALVYYRDSTANISGNAILTENSAEYGGAIANYGCGQQFGGVLIEGNAKIFNNTADFGGAICNGGVTIMNGGEIYNNTAIEGGAVIEMPLDPEFIDHLTINAGEIYSNTAETYGGAVLNYFGTVNLNGGLVHDNSTVISGAGFFNDGLLNITGGEIYNNTLDIQGYEESDGTLTPTTGGGITNNSTLILTGGSIYSNEATEGSGIYNSYLEGEDYILTLEMSKDVNINQNNEVFLNNNSYISVTSEFNYDGLVAVLDCENRNPGRILVKTEYGNKLGSELLYFEDSNQRFELNFETIEDGHNALLRTGDQGLSSVENSNIVDQDIFISAEYFISFNQNIEGYTVTLPSEIIKLWNEDLINITLYEASANTNSVKFIEWNDKEDGSGTKYSSPINYNLNEDLVLYAQWTENSNCTILLPKNIIIDGEEGKGIYVVAVKGKLVIDDILEISPPDNVLLNSYGKNSIKAYITQNQKYFIPGDVKQDSFTAELGEINIKNITAGKWFGNFSFNVSINSTL